MNQFELEYPGQNWIAKVSTGHQICQRSEVWPAPQGRNRQAVVCIDRAVFAAAPEIQMGLAAAGWQAEVIVLDAGESLKDFQQIYPLYGQFLELGLQRRSLVVAVGGGSLGDAVGFVAATYLRGLPWVNVPTTLLAQVDSCLGGKTGLNHVQGKNLIGAIYQPQAIVCDLDFLTGIPQREYYSGLGEMLKYGLIHDPDYWDYLLTHAEDILNGQPDVLAHAVSRALEIKAHFVKADLQDLLGIRAALNFGHTFAHGLEAATGYGYYRHGEAVLQGMLLAVLFSAHQGVLEEATAQAIVSVLQQWVQPSLPETVTAQQVTEAMRHDKKNDGAQIQLLLLQSVGQVTSQAYALTEINDFLDSELHHLRA